MVVPTICLNLSCFDYTPRTTAGKRKWVARAPNVLDSAAGLSGKIECFRIERIRTYPDQVLMAIDRISIRGARQHNLKNISLEIPRDKLVVITGVSGSGKSSLAFDTIYAEGQRRYVESLSAYARQFLGQMDKPDVDYIEGLSPAVSIDQKSTSRNPRSTV